MPMKRCEHGHYYDPEKHTTCPACGISDLDINETKPQNEPPPLPHNADEGSTRPRKDGPHPDGATIGIVRKKLNIDPVVGWLVCIEGSEQGRDYRVRSEKNFIGRSEKMDICIRGDDTISRERHAAVSFNPRKCTFRLQPGEGRGLVYLNDEEVDFPTELSAYDIIELGQTKLMFVPFCGESFQWK